MPTTNAGRPGLTTVLSYTRQASAPRSSAAMKSAMAWPPISSSAVAREPDVHGQRALVRQDLDRFQEREQLALVVDDTACEEDAVAHGGLEGRALPEFERLGRLHVEMAVHEHGRRLRARRGAHLAHHDGAPEASLDRGLTARSPDELGHPLGRTLDVARARVGADARDAQEFRELVQPGAGFPSCCRPRHSRLTLRSTDRSAHELDPASHGASAPDRRIACRRASVGSLAKRPGEEGGGAWGRWTCGR